MVKRHGTGLLAVVALLAALPYGAGSASASPRSLFVLSLGGSTARGMQPVGLPGGATSYTHEGYPDIVANVERHRGFQVLVRRLGCPGATLGAMLGVAKPLASDTCYKKPLTQLTEAKGFLQRHVHDAGIVTLEFGMNTLRPCFAADVVNARCAAVSFADTQNLLPRLLTILKKAAGPRVTFVGLNYADPFVVYPRYGQSAQHFGHDSLNYVVQLNVLVDHLYQAAGVPVANVAGGFAITSTTPSTNPAFPNVPTNVANACLLTWICTRTGAVPDDHPNFAGQQVIANRILGVVPAPWRVVQSFTP